ncbi:unnamed protein product [Linum trigynum]|uniref:CCHC-type domain-containing protein n=1 Tax=Linum trigynum TaxID=586398 RepID=A0AAV2FWI7_9ROSI
MYERQSTQNKASLIRRIVNLKYKDGHLSDSWETLVVSLSNSAPNGKLTMDIVKDSMLNEEARRKELGIASESHALVADNSGSRGRNINRNSNFKNSQNLSNSRWRSKGRSKSVSRPRGEITCYHCNQPRHMTRECRILKREQARGRGVENREKDETTDAATDGDVVIVCDASLLTLLVKRVHGLLTRVPHSM